MRKLKQVLQYLTKNRESREFYKEFAGHSLKQLIPVVVIFVLTIILFVSARSYSSGKIEAKTEAFAEYTEIKDIDLDNSLHLTALKDALNYFEPGMYREHDVLIEKIENYNEEKFTNADLKKGADSVVMSIGKGFSIFSEFIVFIIIFGITLFANYFLTKSLGVLKFVFERNNKQSWLRELFQFVKTSASNKDFYSDKNFYQQLGTLLLINIGKVAAYLILFAPAYVIAYSIKTRIDTDSYLFMILLGVFSNGILINYTNRFYTFLKNESKKGYVETAIVKNLNNGYELNKDFKLADIFKISKLFDGHVFRHIYANAEFQYLKTVKEMASFLITGLIIIEMALNIQGHIGYTLMKAVYNSRYDQVIFIVFLIFVLVKLTEITIDTVFTIRMNQYENKV